MYNPVLIFKNNHKSKVNIKQLLKNLRTRTSTFTNMHTQPLLKSIHFLYPIWCSDHHYSRFFDNHLRLFYHDDNVGWPMEQLGKWMGWLSNFLGTLLFADDRNTPCKFWALNFLCPNIISFFVYVCCGRQIVFCC